MFFLRVQQIIPFVPTELSSFIVEAYVQMRQQDKARAAKTGGRGTLTARQLLSILRMSQALARLELRLAVTQRDVEEAIRLVQVSKASVLESRDDSEHAVDVTSRIYTLLRDRATENKQQFGAFHALTMPSGAVKGWYHVRCHNYGHVTERCPSRSFSFHYLYPAVLLAEAAALVQQHGFRAEQLDEVIQTYEGLMLLQVNASRTRVDFSD